MGIRNGQKLFMFLRDLNHELIVEFYSNNFLKLIRNLILNKQPTRRILNRVGLVTRRKFQVVFKLTINKKYGV